jgi:hypothetical protein
LKDFIISFIDDWDLTAAWETLAGFELCLWHGYAFSKTFYFVDSFLEEEIVGTCEMVKSVVEDWFLETGHGGWVIHGC